MSIRGSCEYDLLELPSGEPYGLEFFDSVTNCRVRCIGLEVRPVFYYFKNGKEVSRRKLRLPSLRPCDNYFTEDCYIWVYNGVTKRYYAMYRTRKGVRFTGISLPRGVIPKTVMVRVPRYSGKPVCRFTKPCEGEVDRFWNDVDFLSSYTRKNPKKGAHDLYIEGHCITEYKVYEYPRLSELISELRANCAGCHSCVAKFIEDNGFEMVVSQGGFEFSNDFYTSKPPFPSRIVYSHHYFGNISQAGGGSECTP